MPSHVASTATGPGLSFDGAGIPYYSTEPGLLALPPQQFAPADPYGIHPAMLSRLTTSGGYYCPSPPTAGAAPVPVSSDGDDKGSANGGRVRFDVAARPMTTMATTAGPVPQPPTAASLAGPSQHLKLDGLQQLAGTDSRPVTSAMAAYGGASGAAALSSTTAADLNWDGSFKRKPSNKTLKFNVREEEYLRKQRAASAAAAAAAGSGFAAGSDGGAVPSDENEGIGTSYYAASSSSSSSSSMSAALVSADGAFDYSRHFRLATSSIAVRPPPALVAKKPTSSHVSGPRAPYINFNAAAAVTATAAGAVSTIPSASYAPEYGTSAGHQQGP
jgi:hypothetical protein